MPTYRIKDPSTGKTIKITGPQPPTEEELTQIFSEVNQKDQPLLPGGPSALVGPPGMIARGGEFLLQKAGILSEGPSRVDPLLQQAGAGALNVGLFGVPEALARRTTGRPLFPKPETGTEQIARAAGGVGGFLVGGPEQLAARGAQALVRGAGIGSKAIQTAAGLFTGAASVTPETNTGEMAQWGRRLLQGAIAAPFGLLGGTGQRLAQVKGTKLAAKFADDTAAAANKVYKAAQTKFDDAMSSLMRLNPNARVNLRPLVDDFINMSDDAQKLLVRNIKNAGDTKAANQFLAMLRDPKLAEKMTLKQSQAFKNMLAYVDDPNLAEVAVNSVRGKIVKAQLEKFPQFADDLANYSQFMDDFQLLSHLREEVKVLPAVAGQGEKSLGNPVVRRAFNRLFPRGVKTEVGSFRNASLITNFLINRGLYFATGAGIAAGIGIPLGLMGLRRGQGGGGGFE